MNQSEIITKAAELIQCFHMWGISKEDALAIAVTMQQINQGTSNMDWRNSVNRYVDPKSGGKVQ